MGDAEAYGDFAAFRAAVLGADISADVDAPRVRYVSPSQGIIEMGWEGDVLNNGVALQLDGYGRYDNPRSQSGCPGDDISFTFDDSYLELDLDSASRDASGFID